MGRSKLRRVIDPRRQDLLTNMFGSLSDTKKLDPDTLSKVFSDNPGQKDALADIKADIISKFSIDYELKVKTTFLLAPKIFDKMRTFKLPPYPEKIVTRVVISHGSHEVFMPNTSNPFLKGNAGLFCANNHALKFSPRYGELTYNNKSSYNKEAHPGKGFKYPHKRQLLILDFYSESQDVANNHSSEELSKVVDSISKVVNPDLISDLTKRVTEKTS